MKSIYRTLLNRRLKPLLSGLRGDVLDAAAGLQPSYLRFFGPEVRLTRSDAALAGDARMDFDARLPFGDARFDHALCINALYIARDPVFTLKELARVTKPGGQIILATPFVFPEAREPHDYVRWTSEGLTRLWTEAGLGAPTLLPYGGHFTSALYVIEPFLRFGFLRAPAQLLASGLDGLIPASYRVARPCPLGYLATARALSV